MPSPFPGMNPYLERDTVWSDFHTSLCVAMRNALVKQLSPDFYVKIGEHLYVHTPEDENRKLVGHADVSVTKRGHSAPDAGGVALLEAPVRAQISEVVDEERVPYLEIYDKEYHSLVTAIELLSPSNKKKGADRDQFLSERRKILRSSVHYVEIDLLRGGPRLPIDDLPKCDYYILVSREEERPEMGLWPIKLSEPLPTIPIPLPAPKWEARVNLQELLHQVYDEGGYAIHIYDGVPMPPLRKKDAAWARPFSPK